ncbi:hypothetical protein [Chenggangzhangella methanolivorans]|uniref:Uncharacterized protein n=1 Tax=Chenggangzhangella methanolivorans TaxID=1437009 RepID=A0A9E6RHA0_9HYPH|nr:hypothetical protein [Chenggangzhangella methanolivorans]QZO01431.1 hypothetical protein K6K41_08290 [Chenggangzhangella methanolivorans]
MNDEHPFMKRAKFYADERLLSLLVFFICMLNATGADRKIVTAAVATLAFQTFWIWLRMRGERLSESSPTPSTDAG